MLYQARLVIKTAYPPRNTYPIEEYYCQLTSTGRSARNNSLIAYLARLLDYYLFLGYRLS